SVRRRAGVNDERNVAVELIQNVLRRRRTDAAKPVSAWGSEWFAKLASDFGEDRMRADSNCDRVQTRGYNLRNNFALRQYHRQRARPEFFGKLQNRLSILFLRIGNFLPPTRIWKVNDQRIKARSSLRFENLRDRNWIERIGGGSVNRLGRTRQ